MSSKSNEKPVSIPIHSDDANFISKDAAWTDTDQLAPLNCFDNKNTLSTDPILPTNEGEVSNDIQDIKLPPISRTAVYTYVAPNSFLENNLSERGETDANEASNNEKIDLQSDQDALDNDSTDSIAIDNSIYPNKLSFPCVYTDEFIMHCLANQIAEAQPDPDIAIATTEPSVLTEEDMKYVTESTVVDESNDVKRPDEQVQDTDDKLDFSDVDVDENKLTQPKNSSHQSSSSKENRTSNSVENEPSTTSSSGCVPSDTLTDQSVNTEKKPDLNGHKPTKGSTDPENESKEKPQDTADNLKDKHSSSENNSKEDKNTKKLKDEEEARAEKESKLESYKHFLARQENQLEIDYPGIRVKIEANALPSRVYFVMNALSAIIASYGLIMNSAAVVIGAMLVAMMLGPISGAALAIIDYRIPFLRRSLFTVIAGAGMVVAIGFMIGLMHAGQPLSNEILSRTQPTSMDLMVALAGGSAGALAMVSPHLSVAVVGVAVATALVPPLAASGILFANGEGSLGFGALLLAITNIVAIQFTNALVLWFTGFRRLMGDDYKSSTLVAFFKRNAAPLLLLLGIGAYLTVNLNAIAQQQRFENEISTIISDYFSKKDNVLTGTQFIQSLDHQTIRAVIRGETRPSSSDAKNLEDLITKRIENKYTKFLTPHVELRYIPEVVIESAPRAPEKFDNKDATILAAE